MLAVVQSVQCAVLCGGRTGARDEETRRGDRLSRCGWRWIVQLAGRAEHSPALARDPLTSYHQSAAVTLATNTAQHTVIRG